MEKKRNSLILFAWAGGRLRVKEFPVRDDEVSLFAYDICLLLYEIEVNGLLCDDDEARVC